MPVDVVVLNGGSSSRKTSIARWLRERTVDSRLLLAPTT
jgi:chloramphenicol 3-O-phosphotransferase